MAKTVKMEPLNGFPKQEKRDDISDNDPNVASNGSVAKQEDTDSPLNWLAEVALYKGDRDFDVRNFLSLTYLMTCKFLVTPQLCRKTKVGVVWPNFV